MRVTLSMSVLWLLCIGLRPWTVPAMTTLPERESKSLGFNVSQLEYRCELPSGGSKMDESADFLAVLVNAEEGETVVGSVEFGLLSDPRYGKWVYLNGVNVKDAWQKKGVAAAMLTRLLAYIKLGWPGVTGAYLLVGSSEKFVRSLYEKLGFVKKGKPFSYDGYVYRFSSSHAEALPIDLPLIDMQLPFTNDPQDAVVLAELFSPTTK
ncbi:hypothetical protein FOZ60_014360 [Perkinsus olseni]|uniref:N-acetyltransferase domain-containing protein n=1 Tax=Perkinsus olseni TaxID=32597 RepID=A0A7J6N7K8_PEROL|nr:hypothetical protein FOZ60_014360 [Perkinsus olseni]